MFQRFSKTRSLLIEINPHQVLVAGIMRQRGGPVLIEYAAEFDRENLTALRFWLDGKKDLRKRWMGVTCGFVSRQGVLQRETLNSTNLLNVEQLIATVRDRQALLFSSSSAPFRDIQPDQWTFRAVNAVDGKPLPQHGSARPALLLGVPNEELHEFQQQLLDCRLMPQRLEPALLPLFGSLYQIMERRRYPRAAVVFVLRQESLTIYILGKEGIHTPGRISQGLSTIAQQVRKEFGLENDAEAMQRLMNPSDDLRRRMPKLLRSLGTAIRPVINSYEMTTGQPAGDVYCAYLPPSLAWLAEPLVGVIDHGIMKVDCHEWITTAKLETAPDVPAFGPHWLGALSLAANFSEAAGADSEISFAASSETQPPWHVNCRLSIEAPGSRLIGRRFLVGAGAIALMLFALTLTAWQVYVSRSLQEDTTNWREQMASKEKLIKELSVTLTELNARSARVNQAYALMREPYQATELLMNLGRTVAPHMRIDRIDATENRVILTGSLLEPAEDASRSLGRYLETLRHTPQIGPLFSSISATSLQREGDADSLMFEITMKLRPAP